LKKFQAHEVSAAKFTKYFKNVLTNPTWACWTLVEIYRKKNNKIIVILNSWLGNGFICNKNTEICTYIYVSIIYKICAKNIQICGEKKFKKKSDYYY
jgi:hypothetical protein